MLKKVSMGYISFPNSLVYLYLNLLKEIYMIKLKFLLCTIFIMFYSVVLSQDTTKPNEKSLYEFLDGIGKKESGNKYNITSKTGYLGKYQFHPRTLKAIGVKTTKKEFLNNKTIQDNAMIKLLKVNKEYLKKEIEKHSGKIINGIVITESGILAAAHLGGYGSVKRFLTHGIEFKDGNGTKLTSYLIKYSGYILNLD